MAEDVEKYGISDVLYNLARGRIGHAWGQEQDGGAGIYNALARGMAEINEECGMQDYEEPGRAQSLLLSWLLYDNAGLGDEVKQRYKKDLVTLQAKNDWAGYKNDKTMEQCKAAAADLP